MSGSPTPYPHPTPLLTGLLKQVSRSFYLTLRILPQPVRQPISLAYLLARATDTIADTSIIPVDQRLQALAQLRDHILNPTTQTTGPEFGELAASQSNPAERELLARIHEALATLRQTPTDDTRDIQEVIEIITSGQTLDLQRFQNLPPGQVRALANSEELDDYTWRVAGCVGQFWTRICSRKIYPHSSLNLDSMIKDGIRFGKGLQLVNILRDLPADLQQGRCYLPLQELSKLHLQPQDLLQTKNETTLRPLYLSLISLAHQHLTAGWHYTCRLPSTPIRLRLACAWPILIGASTLQKLAQNTILDPTKRVRIQRSQVYKIIRLTLWRLPRRKAWERLFEDCSKSA
jgi:farnesyl-diphosphate farnesyltransferase